MQIGLPAILFVVFLTLKLCGVIAWSWLWVLSPLWAVLLLSLVLYAIAGVILVWKSK